MFDFVKKKKQSDNKSDSKYKNSKKCSHVKELEKQQQNMSMSNIVKYLLFNNKTDEFLGKLPLNCFSKRFVCNKCKYIAELRG